MAYTRSWSDATPAGTRAANQIDDAIREFKVDLHERMDDIVDDWAADPVVVQGAVSGRVTGRVLLFGPHILQNRQDEHDTQHQDNYVQLDIGETMNGQLLVPAGITITDFDAVVDIQLSGTFTVELYEVAYLTGTKNSIVTRTRSTNGVGLTDSGTISYTVNAGSWLGIRAVCSGIFHARFYGCRITYDRPDGLSVI